MSSNSPSGTTTTTQVSSPWVGQQPYLLGGTGPAGSANAGQTVPGVFPSAANLYQNYKPQYFPQSTVAPLNANQNLGIGMEAGLGMNGDPAVNSADSALTGINSGAFLGNNPYFNSMSQDVLSQVLPSVESTFAGGNRMNSPGAAFAAAQGATNALAPIAYGDYTNQVGNIIKSAALSPGEQGAVAQQAGMVQDAGNQQQQQTQAQINDAINRWNFQQQLPYNLLGTYEQMTGGNFGGTSTMTQPYFQNQTANILGGALGLGSLGSSLFGSSGMFPGALASIFGGSDRRLKAIRGPSKNALEKLATLTLSDARFRWEKPEEERPMIMAQDVAKILPHAVCDMQLREDDEAKITVVNFAELIPLMIGAINELAAEVRMLRAKSSGLGANAPIRVTYAAPEEMAHSAYSGEG